MKEYKDEKMNRQHGGDIETYRARYGAEPMDYSSNVSPLGVPDGVAEAIRGAVAKVDRYPDPQCRQLREKIAADEGVLQEQVLPGAGAADLIYRFAAALRPAKTLLPVPSFSEYEHALAAVGGGIEPYLLTEETGFRPGDALLEQIGEETDLVLLCEPNNPTGVLDKKAFLEKVLDRCGKQNAWLFIDESFLDLTAYPEEHTMADMLSPDRKLIILRSFTKMYAMAGVRLGYCLCGVPAMLEKMKEMGPPWSVSNLAQQAGIAALEADDYKERFRRMVAEERPKLAAGLAACGMQVYPGAANYLFFRGPVSLPDDMAARGIMIRDCSNYRGLGPGWYRIAVRTPEENARFLGVLREVCL